MDDMPETEANSTPLAADLSVEGIPPRGDLIQRVAEFIDSRSKPQIVGARDPVSGVVAPVVLLRDSEGNERVEALPAKVFDEYLNEPRFRRGTANLTSLDSFIAHVKRFCDTESAVFACDDRDSPSLTAVLDYNPANRADVADKTLDYGAFIPEPRHGRHRSSFAFPLSDEWTAWKAKDSEPMTMAAFAAFLEDRIVDVIAPGEVALSAAAEKFIAILGGKDRIATPTRLIELSKGLHIYENSAVSEARNLSSGEGEISFVSEHADSTGAPLLVPTTFQIGIPVFRNGDLYSIVARLRYRKTPGGIVFFYELWQTDRVFDDAFSRATERVEEETGLPVLLGSPE